MFTDLVGSTELMSQLGDRAFDDLRRRHFAALSKAVGAHGGEEVKNTGDGLMAVFESAAEAVEAAVVMQQATARQSLSHPLAIGRWPCASPPATSTGTAPRIGSVSVLLGTGNGGFHPAVGY